MRSDPPSEIGQGGTVGAVTRARSVVLSSFVLAVAYAYGFAAAGARPFTTAADLYTAIPFAPAVALAVAALRGRRRSAHDRGVDAPGPARAAPWDRYRWIVLAAAALVLLEAVTYVAGFFGGRSSYPTVSSVYDSLSRWRAAKAVMIAGWLALGYGLFRP